MALMDNPWYELAIRLRTEVWPYLSAEDREWFDEDIQAGEYGIAIDNYLAIAIKQRAELPPALLDDAARLGVERVSELHSHAAHTR